MLTWTAGSALISAFLGSTVEVVEAFTIVLAVATVRGWRPALAGTAGGLLLLTALVVIFGPLLELVKLSILQLAVGVLLLLFGLRWLRKAILRYAGHLALHDEAKTFAREAAALQEAEHQAESAQDWIAGIAAFKAVMLEGLEVIFIVIAVGAGRGLLVPAAGGALGACVIVLLAGFVLHRPLTRVPENTLKFCVGVLLASFGIFWTGEGLDVPWPGGDLTIPGLVALFALVGWGAVAYLQRSRKEAVQ